MEKVVQCKWFFCCPMKYYYEKGVIEKHWTDEYCHGDWKSCIRFQMEEAGKYHPDEMLPDGSIMKKSDGRTL